MRRRRPSEPAERACEAAAALREALGPGLGFWCPTDEGQGLIELGEGSSTTTESRAGAWPGAPVGHGRASGCLLHEVRWGASAGLYAKGDEPCSLWELRGQWTGGRTDQLRPCTAQGLTEPRAGTLAAEVENQGQSGAGRVDGLTGW